jgi:hypothetical protein
VFGSEAASFDSKICTGEKRWAEKKSSTGMAFLFTTRQMIKYQQVSAEIWLRNMIPEYMANTMSWWGSREEKKCCYRYDFLGQFKKEIAG